jgi:hypothetical protein
VSCSYLSGPLILGLTAFSCAPLQADEAGDRARGDALWRRLAERKAELLGTYRFSLFEGKRRVGVQVFKVRDLGDELQVGYELLYESRTGLRVQRDGVARLGDDLSLRISDLDVRVSGKPTRYRGVLEEWDGPPGKPDPVHAPPLMGPVLDPEFVLPLLTQGLDLKQPGTLRLQGPPRRHAEGEPPAELLLEIGPVEEHEVRGAKVKAQLVTLTGGRVPRRALVDAEGHILAHRWGEDRRIVARAASEAQFEADKKPAPKSPEERWPTRSSTGRPSAARPSTTE